jgi:hypothetical protein
MAALATTTTCGGAAESVSDFEAGYVAAVCGYAVRCGLAPDTDWCARSLRPTIARFTASVQAGRIRYDAGLGRRCYTAFAGQPCTVGGLRERLADDSCRDLLVGAVPQGGACFSERDCAGRAPCQGALQPSCNPGVCGQARPPRTADGSCMTNDDCLRGGVCSLGYDPQAPARCPPPLDQLCGAPGSCTGDKTCVVDQMTTQLKCVSLARDGEPCVGIIPCAGLSSFCRQGTCQPRGGEGAACDGAFSCGEYLDCVAGGCVRRPTADEPCTNDSASCSVGSCLGGRCTVAGCGTPDAGTSAVSSGPR